MYAQISSSYRAAQKKVAYINATTSIFVNCTNSYMGLWQSSSASALRAKSPGFDSPHLQADFECSRVRFTLGASIGTYSLEVEPFIAAIVISFAEFVCRNVYWMTCQ